MEACFTTELKQSLKKFIANFILLNFFTELW